MGRPARQVARATVLVLILFIYVLFLVTCGGGGSSNPPPPPPPPPPTPTTYSNPLAISISTGGRVESCADPSIIHSESDGYWYVYCTADPLNDQDKNGFSNWNFRGIPIVRSKNLATWEYVGTVFASRPSWVASNGGLWAPAIEQMNGKYYLYFAASATTLPGNGSAIGVATSSTPSGPWTDSGQQVVEPGDRATIDPDVIEEGGQKYIYYGSFDGGVHVRKLSDDGLHSDPASDQLVAVANRFEAPYVVKRGDYFYMFLSVSNCCNGPLTGYSVMVGRSTSPLGPFVDKDGVSLLAGRAGGTTALAMNGSRWVGPGHNAVFTDMAGQDWTVYHAIDRDSPYFGGAVGFTKRPLMMDAVDWVDGWPVVRGGNWVSSTAQPKPVAVAGETTAYVPQMRTDDVPGDLNSGLSDEFDANQLSVQWQWVRPPSATSYRLNGSGFEFDTQSAELYGDIDNASVLVENAPAGNYVVETRMRLNLPAEGCCFNYTQAGLVIYGDDDKYIKLAHASIWETRQIEFGKEVPSGAAGYPVYGSTFLEAPDEWTWLRIVKRVSSGTEVYTPYSSRDGVNWSRGGSWTHTLGTQAKIGLVSMNASGFTATFDYVRVYALAN